ncbi:hypothetical protein CRYUN_Cryun26dG0100300 [Craigia yunnanensis]
MNKEENDEKRFLREPKGLLPSLPLSITITLSSVTQEQTTPTLLTNPKSPSTLTQTTFSSNTLTSSSSLLLFFLLKLYSNHYPLKDYVETLFLLTYFQLKNFDILCTHPMFGPESGKSSWVGLPFVYDKVMIGNEESRVKRCVKFLDIF